MIDKWKNKLELNSWTIDSIQIDPESVTYDEDCPDEQRYFVGIMAKEEALCATIFHDVPLTEEHIVHELLHVKYPDWSEDQVNKETEKLLNQNKDE